VNDLIVVLGANGGVGKQLSQRLLESGKKVRNVARSLNGQSPDNFQADLLVADQAIQALDGAKVAYLCVGLSYDIHVWKTQWPLLMDNIIEAAAINKTALVFLDNVYMYGPAPLAIPFDETHPQNPSSKKGAVRKGIANTLLDAHKEGKIRACIARAADFFGPDATNSILYISFLENMLKGKAPQLLFPPNVEHTFANTRDIAEGMFLLGEAEDTWGEVWHLPVGKPISIAEMGQLFNKALSRNDSFKELPRFIQKLLRLFIKPLKELEEMRYQFENPYHMNWDKFQNRFPNFKARDYSTVIDEMIISFKSK
jgi:nucleoside-diphosphate-sugar epimerase